MPYLGLQRKGVHRHPRECLRVRPDLNACACEITTQVSNDARDESRRYPLILLTGRGSSSQWHTQTRTSKSPVLRGLYPAQPYVEIAPADATQRGITGDEWVKVVSARGCMRARAFITPTIPPGQVFVPMHYAQTNQLTDPSFDPYSRQPSYKYCAVNVCRLAHWERTSPDG